jgi:hypothetical protein
MGQVQVIKFAALSITNIFSGFFIGGRITIRGMWIYVFRNPDV